MAKKKKQRGHEEEHENHERWLVSYADFITLLFAFFVVMYSISRVDNKKLVETAQAIAFALHFEGTGGVGALPLFEGPPSEGGCIVNLGAGGTLSPSEHAAVETMRKRIEKRLKPFLVEKTAPTAVQIVTEGRRLAIRLAAAHFFDEGFAALRPEALPVLDAVADELVPLGRAIRAEGHTDGAAPTGGRYRNNWELSASRAATVVAYLEEAHHVKPELLSAVGVGSARPIGAEDTEAGREVNRRIELVVELQPADLLGMAVR